MPKEIRAVIFTIGAALACVGLIWYLGRDDWRVDATHPGIWLAFAGAATAGWARTGR